MHDAIHSTAKLVIAFLALFAIVHSASAQSTPPRRALITQNIDETQLVTLTGNMRKEMTAANDRGPVADELVLEMSLQLNRAPEVQQAMDDLVNEFHNPQSSQYHKWLTADQIEERFAPAEADFETVSRWLGSHGFTVNVAYRANGVIDFSGPARAVREAFHTELHNLSVHGAAHIANASGPKIPAALAGAVHGVVSMNNFRPRAMNRLRPQDSYPCTAPFPCLYPTWYGVVPDDLHTIYDLNRLYAAGITGEHQTIAVLEDSDLYSAADWNTFRTTFGLAQRFPLGSLTQVHPQPPRGAGTQSNCADPGVNADDIETELDVEWASAAAPNATIVAAICADQNLLLNPAVLTALQNLLTNGGPIPEIISISYGDSETDDGPSYNAYIRGLYEIAVLQGVSLFISSGDSGGDADVEDWNEGNGVAAYHGINVNGWASTPYNVAVGGTDFADTYLQTTSDYWGSTIGPYFGSALSYIPEIPWNDTCGSALLTSFYGFATPYGANGFCNSNGLYPPPNPFYFEAGSGGPSGCGYGAPSIPAVVSGSCRGYEKPLYQYLVRGSRTDGVRDLPDVSLFAADGLSWGQFYILCDSNPAYGLSCNGPPSFTNWLAGGGTSFSSPIMAGIQALINQAVGDRQGNPNFWYYALAAGEHGINSGNCNATSGNQINSQCVFHDVTLGDNDVNCLPLMDSSGTITGTFNCYIPSGTTGVLSLSNTSYEPVFEAGPGWDFATGLGSVDAYNLVRNWPGSRLH